MIKPKPTQFNDISNWNDQQWLMPTIGSRNKSFVEDPTTRLLYFFKESKQTYPSEFWSEIIASKVGHSLGYNLLDYNVAVLGQRVGCLCKIMHDESLYEDLVHGVNILKEKLPGFEITDRPKVSYQQIIKVFKGDKNLKEFIIPMIETILFDAIVGNTDRHTENWGIIRTFDIDKFLASEAPKEQNLLQRIFTSFVKSYHRILEKQGEFTYTFTPIFDSGSSLGREIPEGRIIEYTSNTQNINKYIDKGWHEIRWNDEKINPFELIKNIRKIGKNSVDPIIKRTINNFSKPVIEKIINNADIDIPQNFIHAKLSLQRKEFIKQLIFLRVERLINCIESD